ncbi:MAG: transcription elongation factor GreA [Ruminococcaceae bacterium]|nr:transcription elongation factor GreA [Oscillospiraceae bacterium]
MAKQYKLTPERAKQLQDELEYLKTVREREVADMIKEARSFGDLSENSEYDEAKNEQGKVYSRISELTDILANCVIIEEDQHERDQIGTGSVIKVRDMEDGFEEEFTIVGSQEADPAIGRISDESPIGRALMGRKAGDEITVRAPAGDIQYLILDVQ